jgi:ribosome maturation factor RimP
LGPFFVSGVWYQTGFETDQFDSKHSSKNRTASRRWSVVKSSVEKVTQLIEPTVQALDLELWGVEHASQGKYSVLRIFIEREAGVTIDDCERVSRQVSAIFDVEEPITGEYTLEVSSPGMDRLLFTPQQFQKYCGEEISVRMRTPVDGRRKFKGTLTDVVDDIIHIQVDGNDFELPHGDIEKANIVY